MKKLFVLLAFFCFTYAVDLPIDFIDGNVLTATELNQWKGQRSGNLLPIGTSLSYVDNTVDIGSSTYKWRNFYAAGGVFSSGVAGTVAFGYGQGTANFTATASTTMDGVNEYYDVTIASGSVINIGTKQWLILKVAGTLYFGGTINGLAKGGAGGAAVYGGGGTIAGNNGAASYYGASGASGGSCNDNFIQPGNGGTVTGLIFGQTVAGGTVGSGAGTAGNPGNTNPYSQIQELMMLPGVGSGGGSGSARDSATSGSGGTGGGGLILIVNNIVTTGTPNITCAASQGGDGGTGRAGGGGGGGGGTVYFYYGSLTGNLPTISVAGGAAGSANGGGAGGVGGAGYSVVRHAK